MTGWRAALALAAAAGVAAAAAPGAEAPRFALPVDCEIGAGCSVQNFFDHDPGPGFRDYACGALSYDGSTGTDIRVPDLVEMRRGVAVVAAAPGRVRGVRDGMPDIDLLDIGLAAVEGREAGNGVVIDHGGGWETQYSHLRQGSVVVRKGNLVEAGDALGLIGMSGRAEFPHVDFEVRFEGRRIDPFVGLDGPAGCGVGAAPLWDAAALEALAYVPTGLLSAGFAAAEPNWKAARRGDYRAGGASRDAPALVFWVSVFGVRAGDTEIARLVAPGGQVVAEKSQRLAARKAQWFSFVGRKRPGSAWPAGTYRGEYRLLREIDGEMREVVGAAREIVVR